MGSGNLMQNAQPKMIIDPKTNTVKIEETLKDTIEILAGMNAKLNNNIN